MVLLALALTVSTSGQPVSVTESFDGLAGDGSPTWLPQTREWVMRDGCYEFLEPLRMGSIAWLTAEVFTDLDLSVRFLIEPEGSGVRAPGIVFRSQDSATHYYVHYDSRNSQIILVRSAPDNEWIELSRVPGVAISAGEWHAARVTCEGPHLAVYLDEKLVAEADDPTLTAGRIGLRAGQGHIRFDDLQVTGAAGTLGREWTLLAQSTPNDDLDRPRLESAERTVAVRGGGYFPVLIKLQDGSLGAVVRGGAPHIGIQGRLDWIRSTDDGRTWSAPSVIVDSGWDDRNPAVGQMADGTIVVAYGECQCYNEQGEWDPQAGNFVLYTVLSHDGGRTWTEKQPLFSGPIGLGCSPYGRIILLSDGTALMSVYGQRDPSVAGPPEPSEVTGDMVGIVRSRDNGRTWSDFSLVSCKGHNELTLLALDDRRLLAAVRNGPGSVDLFESLDAGYTWQGPTPLTQVPQHPADVVRLQSGRLLLVHGNRRVPLGVGSMISEDDGKTWRYDDRVMLAWDSNNGDCGYPSLVQLEDGTIVMLYYSVGNAQFGGEELCLCVRFTEAQWLEAMGKGRR